jgi:hypothetical protein
LKNMVSRVFTQNWVRAGEHFSLRVGSLFFSLVSAHAILWFYNSLADVSSSDFLQRYVPYVIAGGFGLLGYFVSRGLVYRMMHKERIRVYIAICVLFEFVEIVCNFAQAVSSVPAVVWLQHVEGWVHGTLLFLLYVAYSIVPVVTFVLAVVDMDLEKAKYVAPPRMAPSPNGYSAGYRASAVGNANTGTPGGNRTMTQVPRQGQGAGNGMQAPRQGQSNPVLQGTGTGTQGTPANTGWRFPFQQKAAQAGATSANGASPDVIVS